MKTNNTMEKIMTNEPNIIEYIRQRMAEMRVVSTEYYSNYLAQHNEYVLNIDAPSRVGAFTELAEKNSVLTNQFESIYQDVHRQIKSYDSFCEINDFEYSANWEDLLKELKVYQVGINYAGMQFSSNTPSPSDSATK